MNIGRLISYAFDIALLVLLYFSAGSFVPDQLLESWTMIFELSQLAFFVFFSLLFIANYNIFKPYIDKFNVSAHWYWPVLLVPLAFFNFVYNLVTLVATLEDSGAIQLYVVIAIIILSTFAIGLIMFLRDPRGPFAGMELKQKIYDFTSNHTFAYFVLLGFASVYSSILSFYTALRTTAFAAPKQIIRLSETTKTLYLLMMNFTFGIIVANMLNFELYVKLTGDSFTLLRLPIVFIIVYLPYKAAIWLVDPSWKKSWFEAVWPCVYFLATLGVIYII